MNARSLAALGACCLAWIHPAHAAGAVAADLPSDVGFSFGLRGGASMPWGRAKAGPLADVVAFSVPIGVEVGAFLSPSVWVGGTLAYGFTQYATSESSTCPTAAGTTCTARQLRVGLGARWHLHPSARVSPWIGIGAGYDIVNLAASDAQGSTLQSGSLHGFELLDTAVGLELRPARFWGFGPWVDASLGHYFGAPDGWPIHGWLTGGLRLYSVL